VSHKQFNVKNKNDGSSGRLIFSAVINLLITVAEVAGGLLSNSLALLSDALHNLSDTVAIFIAYIACQVSKKASSQKRTFGFKRIEILAALFNSIVLIVISVFLFIEAYHRFKNPSPVKGEILLIVAITGLAGNLISAFILKNSSKKNLNIRAAYLHLVSDTMSSVAVIIGGTLMYYYGLYWIDPLISVIIGLYIIRETYSILNETINILMQFTPSNLDLELIKLKIEELPEVNNIHHLHAWNLNDREIHFDFHLNLDNNLTIDEATVIRRKIIEILNEQFGIYHITIQFEYNCCKNREMIFATKDK